MSVSSQLAERVVHLLETPSTATGEPRERILITLAGIPGSGKSTTAVNVAQELNTKYHIPTVVVGMDGYHYTRTDLVSRIGEERAVKYRGAPYTFDAAGVVDLAAKLRQPIDVYFPTFDHAIKDPIEDGGFVSASTRVVILEGLYVHLKDSPWNEIMDLTADSWFVDVDISTARERLAKRHLASGIVKTIEEGEARADSNDLVNGVYIKEHSAPAKFHFSTGS